MARSLRLFGLYIAIQVFCGVAERLFLSIDCGGTANHTDGSGIKWVGDDGYIKTGKAAQVQVKNSYYQQDNSLRYFPPRRRAAM
ncbi:hypothetical protein EJ110_NYTH19428 [Nymphaea thermarum]|nr:hypothetical protein EJ110_NYTH19428 [Nymphaea thermarum]